MNFKKYLCRLFGGHDWRWLKEHSHINIDVYRCSSCGLYGSHPTSHRGLARTKKCRTSQRGWVTGIEMFPIEKTYTKAEFLAMIL